MLSGKVSLKVPWNRSTRGADAALEAIRAKATTCTGRLQHAQSEPGLDIGGTLAHSLLAARNKASVDSKRSQFANFPISAACFSARRRESVSGQREREKE
jgi:hypothetical protein